jgi:hypothetical protein
MKIFLLVLFSFYFSLEFFGSFAAWMKSKSNKEYGLRLVDTLFSAAMIFAFIKLVEVL